MLLGQAQKVMVEALVANVGCTGVMEREQSCSSGLKKVKNKLKGKLWPREEKQDIRYLA